MTKFFLVIFLSSLCQFNLQAQKKKINFADISYSIAGNVGIGAFSNGGVTFGADIEGSTPYAKDIKLTGSAGFQSFSYRSTAVKYWRHYIPLLVGVKGNLDPELYLHGQFGYAVPINNGGSFAYALGVGYVFKKNLDVGIKLLNVKRFNHSAVSVRVARNL